MQVYDNLLHPFLLMVPNPLRTFSVSEKMDEELIRPPTPEEIKEATFAINADKAVRQDGF